ncbi:hypothetical protein PR003_g17501 [Phytophthora rubi]|uniref:Uncharacterized protein n=1 Tax=Phytophthora rubi TaxID=129364 RepID=A0A6A4EDS4_9STRA|nr:hypothetical protein PR003_g17501 [Phytophthora rubi]
MVKSGNHFDLVHKILYTLTCSHILPEPFGCEKLCVAVSNQPNNTKRTAPDQSDVLDILNAHLE